MRPLRGLTRIASPGGKRGSLTSFIFHRVLDKPDPLFPAEPDVERFKILMSWIQSQFVLLHPEQACEKLTAQTLPERAALITFDDGYQDNYSNALPILQAENAAAAFFVATGYTRGGCMFNDAVIHAVRNTRLSELSLDWVDSEAIALGTIPEKRNAIAQILNQVKYLPAQRRSERVEQVVDALEVEPPKHIMMNEAEIRALSDAGMAIGGHTISHPILRELSKREAFDEVAGGMANIESITGRRPQLFAYPNGKPGVDYDTEHCAMVKKAGFMYAFSTVRGVSTASSDKYQLQRFTAWDQSRFRFGSRMLMNFRNSTR